jgi:hypothetical protein
MLLHCPWSWRRPPVTCDPLLADRDRSCPPETTSSCPCADPARTKVTSFDQPRPDFASGESEGAAELGYLAADSRGVPVMQR